MMSAASIQIAGAYAAPAPPQGPISDEEALMIQTTIDFFRSAGNQHIANLLDQRAADRCILFGAGDIVPIQLCFKEMLVA